MKTVAERVKILEGLHESDMSTLSVQLGRALNDRSPTIRGLAVELVGHNGLVGMLQTIQTALKDPNSEVRMLAIECITRLTDHNFPVKTIARFLHDEDELVRIAATEALAEHGNASVLSDLHKALNDISPLVRSYVAEAIGAIGNKKSIAILERYLQREEDERATLGYYVGLSLLDGRDVLQNFIELFESDDYRVRSAVINSLDQISSKGKAVDKIYPFLKIALKREKTIAVKNSIEKALKRFRK